MIAVCRGVLALAFLILWPLGAGAAVTRVVVDAREAVLAGAAFGHAGPYEKLRGRIELELDPGHPANRPIVDLDRAPRNERGRVEASADFVALRPRTPPPGGGTLLLEVPNRGGMAALAYFNRASWSLDPVHPGEFGDGLLMRQGLTVIWVGWQFDVPRRPGLLRLRAPAARELDGPLEGLVRSDWVVDAPVRTLPLGHRDHVPYPVTDPDHPDNRLTVRGGRDAPRVVVDRRLWRFARESGDGVVDDREHIHMPAGFQTGKIYELVYRARDPVVAGIGLAAVRDAIAHAKHEAGSPFTARRAIGVGISQSGRFLRHFLYQGFNTDEAGRRVFDGMLVHTAGAGRGSFNHRFAQPSRDAHRFSAFFYPTDLFPFTTRRQTDPEVGVDDGLAAGAGDPANLPRIFFTNTGYEYWGRAASLIHTSVDGTSDIAPLPNERIYHLAGGQHFVGEFPPAARLDGSPAYRGNPLDFLVMLRALLVRLLEWVGEDRPPPPSAYPRLADGSLVPVDRLKFPKIPGVRVPTVVHHAHRVDYGRDWSRGVVSLEPPRVGRPFPALVPQVDDDGNEVAGLRTVELRAPLATFAPWNLRGGAAGNAHELTDFLGTYVPLPRTESERQRAGDPRPSLERRYRGKSHYLAKAREAARALVADGVLLVEDVAAVLARAERRWEWIWAARTEP